MDFEIVAQLSTDKINKYFLLPVHNGDLVSLVVHFTDSCEYKKEFTCNSLILAEYCVHDHVGFLYFQLNMDGTWVMQASYYNKNQALWEPLLEPVEVSKGGLPEYIPWELKIHVSKQSRLI